MTTLFDTPVLAFLHENLDAIPAGHSELQPDAREKLLSFRDKLATGRLVKHWANGPDLASKVARSLTLSIRSHPRPGWVRGPAFDQAPLLTQLNQLQTENEHLRRQLSSIRPSEALGRLAEGDEEFTIELKYQVPERTRASGQHGIRSSAYIGADLMHQYVGETVINRALTAGLVAANRIDGSGLSVSDVSFKTIRLQLETLGLIGVMASGGNLFWQLTSKGKSQFVALRVVKAAKAREAPTP